MKDCISDSCLEVARYFDARVLALIASLAVAATLSGCLVAGRFGSGNVRGNVDIGLGDLVGNGVTLRGGAGGVSVGLGAHIGGSTPDSRSDSSGASSVLLRKPLASGRLTSGFGRRHGRQHNGVDYGAPRGTAIYAAGDGVVVLMERSASFGNHVRIRHGESLVSGYAHLAAFAEGLREGLSVKRGQFIGAVGDTGWTSGPHLHYEVMRDGRFIDPLGVVHTRH